MDIKRMVMVIALTAICCVVIGMFISPTKEHTLWFISSFVASSVLIFFVDTVNTIKEIKKGEIDNT